MGQVILRLLILGLAAAILAMTCVTDRSSPPMYQARAEAAEEEAVDSERILELLMWFLYYKYYPEPAWLDDDRKETC